MVDEVAIGAWRDPLALIAEEISSGLRDRETNTYTLETRNRSVQIKVAQNKLLSVTLCISLGSKRDFHFVETELEKVKSLKQHKK